MATYVEIESALKAKILSVFSDEISDTRCKIGDMDKVFDAIFAENEEHGCIIEYNGGNLSSDSPFNKPVWIWSILCIIVIRYNDTDIEDKLRAVVQKISDLLDGDFTLGGVTPLARIVDLADAQPISVNDVPFYWLPFIVEAIDR